MSELEGGGERRGAGMEKEDAGKPGVQGEAPSMSCTWAVGTQYLCYTHSSRAFRGSFPPLPGPGDHFHIWPPSGGCLGSSGCEEPPLCSSKARVASQLHLAFTSTSGLKSLSFPLSEPERLREAQRPGPGRSTTDSGPLVGLDAVTRGARAKLHRDWDWPLPGPAPWLRERLLDESNPVELGGFVFAFIFKCQICN